jgi:hypothetical protein
MRNETMLGHYEGRKKCGWIGFVFIYIISYQSCAGILDTTFILPNTQNRELPTPLRHAFTN